MPDNRVDVFIAVGSNIDPERHVVQALRLLGERVKVSASSTFYWTAPIGRTGQPRFLNGIWRIATSLPARELKNRVLRGIEWSLGRIRTDDAYAPRTIDLDIAIYGQVVVDEPDLRLPDADIRTRAFLAVPLVELEPDLVMPDTGEAISSLIDQRQRAQLDSADDITQKLRDIIGGKA